LYEQIGWAPFVLNTVILLAMLVYAMRQVMLRSVNQGDADEEAAIAGLERSDEGGV
ncbi:MAG: MFS transporter, partial [Caulobacter sp.]